MDQLNNLGRVEYAPSTRRANWQTICLTIAIGLALIAAATLAVRLTAANPAQFPTEQQADSRLDDYGLRHPAPIADPASGGGRLDDYGLRHPAP